MKISYSWIKDFVEIDWSSERTGHLLTALGLEVEGIDSYESVRGGLKGVVVGKVLKCEEHPNADRLQIATVDIGDGASVQIICGAPNVKEGQNVAVATVGTTLYDQEKGPWKIRKSKIRGEESIGMICAEDELGLGTNHDGIMVLDDDLQPGKPLAEVFEVLSDQIFEIGLTPNRSDAMSHYGVARDLRAGLIREGHNKPLNVPFVSKFRVDNYTRHISVKVENSSKALRYCGVTLADVEVKESPQWLKNRLEAVGMAPVNNVVDATNYVMLELGQPFHAFDADRISGQKITVKTLEEGTPFKTLDGIEHQLNSEDLMICDEKKPLCIAGIYGGESSGVNENTNNIFLESAIFDPVSIRKTAKRLGLITEASFRFERGIDPDMTAFALKRLVLLIQKLAKGNVSSDIDDFYPKKIEGAHVFLRYQKINTLIGQEIEQSDLKSILASLEIRVNNVTESGMGLTIPPFRSDVNREVDVVEEILRVYGYNNVGFKDKLNATIALNNKYDDHKIQALLGAQLIGQGFYEIMSNSLTDEKHVRADGQGENTDVKLLNPLSNDLAVMRQSLLDGGLESIAYNLNRKNKNLRFFEFGKSYHKESGSYKEKKHLCLFATGNQQEENWYSAHQKSDFFFLKGIAHVLFERLGINASYHSDQTDYYSESLCIFDKERKLGHFGVIKDQICRDYHVDQEVIFADIDWDAVLEILHLEKTSHSIEPISKFPTIRRDYALLLNDDIRFSQIEHLAYDTDDKWLHDVDLFDVYQGERLPENKKSYAVSFTFLDKEKTLTDKKVDKVMKKLRTRFENELQAELR